MHFAVTIYVSLKLGLKSSHSIFFDIENTLSAAWPKPLKSRFNKNYVKLVAVKCNLTEIKGVEWTSSGVRPLSVDVASCHSIYNMYLEHLFAFNVIDVLLTLRNVDNHWFPGNNKVTPTRTFLPIYYLYDHYLTTVAQQQADCETHFSHRNLPWMYK